MIVISNEDMQIEKLEIEIENTGHITNTYIVKEKNKKVALVIDPAFDENLICKSLEGYTLEKIVVTHSHADHIAALAKLVENTNANVYVHTLDYEGLYDSILNESEIVKTKVLPVNKDKVFCIEDGDEISLGNINFKVIHTPGHTKGSMVIYNDINNILFSGDTIFENSYGRTDLITGSNKDMKESLDKLLNNIEDALVFSGHGKDFYLKNSKRKIRLLFAYRG